MLACLLFLLAFDAFAFANAGLFVVKPLQGSTCHAGKPCSVDWLDDGTNPLLTAIGIVDVGLFHGKQQLVQSIPPVNVATVHSLTFTPIPGAGPNSDNYYISLVSTSLLQNASQPYAAFSSFFRLDGMTGSFDAPDSAATSSFSIPSSIATSGRPISTDTVLSTITVGVISSAPSTSTSSISSKSAHTRTLLGSLSASAIPTVDSDSTAPTPSVDVPIIDPSVLSTAPSGFSTFVLPPSTTLSAVQSLSSSSVPLPSATVANTTPQNSAIACTISKAATTFIVVATLYFVMAF